MPEPCVRLYEGLFLLDQHAVAADMGACVEHLEEVLRRADAEVLILKKWAETRLAYEVKGQKRGTFMLVYFRASSDKLIGMERDCNLSEKILRHMVLQADHIGEVELELAKKDESTSVEMKLRDDQFGRDRAGRPRPRHESAHTERNTGAPVHAEADSAKRQRDETPAEAPSAGTPA